MAGESRALAVQVDLRRLVEPGDVLAEHVLEPAVQSDPAAPGGGQHVGEHVVSRVIGRFLGCDRSAAVELWMRRREVAAAEAVVVLLPAVVRQRLAPQLAARDAAAISERGHEQRIYR